MAAPGMIEIPIEEYDQLVYDSQFLSCLETMGVDNWDGYDCAVEMFQEEYPND